MRYDITLQVRITSDLVPICLICCQTMTYLFISVSYFDNVFILWNIGIGCSISLLGQPFFLLKMAKDFVVFQKLLLYNSKHDVKAFRKNSSKINLDVSVPNYLQNKPKYWESFSIRARLLNQ